jgi:hypothetical protein
MTTTAATLRAMTTTAATLRATTARPAQRGTSTATLSSRDFRVSVAAYRLLHAWLMRSSRFASAGLALAISPFALALALAGCSGGIASTAPVDGGPGGEAADATPGSGGGGGTGGGGSDASTDAGVDDAIWPADAQKITADSPGGGFTPQPPPGSECTYGQVHYTLDLATRAFTWSRCVPPAAAGDVGPLRLIDGARTLSEDEVASIDAAMKKLTPPKDPTACGADKGVYTVTVTTPRGATTYYDSFYVCQGGGKLYVDNIDDVFSAFGAIKTAK